MPSWASSRHLENANPCSCLESAKPSTHQVSLFVALGAGVLSFLSPCVLPLFPASLSFITGMSYTDLHDMALLRQRRRRILLYAGCFIVGFSLIFIALGASFSLMGRVLNTHLPLLQRIGGVIIIFFGLVLVGLFKLPLLMRTVHRGMVLLTAYSLGLAIPFFVSSLAVHLFFQAFRRIAGYLRAMEIGGGVLMILVGLLVLTGSFTVLNSYALRLMPAWLWNFF
jgi:cytochrome c-type biogenesis protein